MTDPTELNTADTQSSETDAPSKTGPSLLFLQTLICPLSRGPLTYDREARELISKKAGVAFPVRDGVPIMLRDEARDLTEAKRS